MNKEELRKLLNLKSKSTPSPFILSTPQGNADSKESPWALDLDSYDQAQGHKILRHNPALRKLDLNPTEVADFYSLYYLTGPSIEESCSDERKLEFVKNILESPDYAALHKRTELNSISSELATEQLGKAYSKLKEEDKKREEEFQKNPNPKKEEIQKDLAMMDATVSALKATEEAVEEFEESMSALGCGTGESCQQFDTSKLGRLFQRIKDDKVLKRIFDRAGKCRRFAQTQKRQKVQHGYDDMIGITLSGQVERLLPTELLQLMDSDLELDAVRRLLENQSLSKAFQGVERVGKGPIIMCVDESGSMDGPPLEWAKAIALTLAYNAKAEKRFCVLIGYSGATEGTRIILPPTKWDEGALLDWLEHFYGGGTELDVPLDKLPNEWWDECIAQGLPRGKTDLILVTDAICRIPEQMEKNFLAWKEREQVNCISIIIGQRGEELAGISNEVHIVPALDLNQDVVQKILTI